MAVENMKAAAVAIASARKIVIFAVLLVFATFPHSTHEFDFGFGGGGDSTDEGSNKKAPVRRQRADRKFKFHKIERVYVDDADGDGEGDDGEAGDGGDDDDNSNDKGAGVSKEEQDFQFEHVHRAQKSRREKAQKSQENEDSESSFFGSIFGGLFGDSKATEKVEAQASNGIIDWLMWLGEKTGRIKPAPPPEPPRNAEGTLLSYLNRWPFNALFPLGKSAKPVSMPRRATGSRRWSTERDDDEQMSDAHFEYLLHTLPGFVVNASHVPADLECRQHMQVFHRQLRGKKLWTLQMLDATGKITSGILRGNINQFGDFDLCTHVKAVVKVTPDVQMRIRGKYCLAHIEAETDIPELKVAVHLAHGRGLVNSHIGNPGHFLSRYSVANWGVCIPNICPASVVKEMLENNLRLYSQTGIDFHVEVNDNDCLVRPPKQMMKLLKKDNKFTASICYILVHVLLVFAALIAEYRSNIKEFLQRYLKTEKSTEIQSQATEGEEENSSEGNEVAEETTSNETKEQLAETEAEETPATDVVSEEKAADPSSLKVMLTNIFKCYSPKQTLMHLLAQDSTDVEFPIFHILKLGACLMLYICLKYIMVGHLPISNREKLVRFTEQPMSILFRAPFIYSDVLLLLSGFLVAYQLSVEMTEKRYIQLLKRITAKITRYLPTVFLVLIFQTWILPHLGTGPLWSNLVGQHAQICEQQMWRNAFSAQNAIDFEDTCSPMTVQLALQVQLYLLGPLIVWLYYTDADAGFFVYGALHALSVAIRYSRTNREHLSMTLFHGINVSKFYRSANLLYASPISRATPYLLGIGAGLFYRTQEGSMQFLENLTPLGWFLCIASIFWCFWSPSSGMSTEFVYQADNAASYAAWSPLVMGMALCWLIFMFPKDENSVLRTLSNSRPVLFLSRITLPIQLVMYVVVLQNTANVRDTIKFNWTDLFNVNEIGAILIYATILALILDVPMQYARHILVDRLFIERPPAEEPESDEPISGAEQSEPETSEPKSEQVTSATPEPPDTIWASDPEEEEQKYLTRRRSSVVANEVESAVGEIKKQQETTEAEEEEEEEEEETEDITEEEEVKKRPPTPPVEQHAPRRRRPISRDD